MLMALIPLFDENIAVQAYSIFSQKDNFFLDPMMLGTRQNDGATNVEGLELIESMGIETIPDDKEIFVPVTNVSVFADMEEQCSAPHERLVNLVDNTVSPTDLYIRRLKELKAKGYKLAIRKISIDDFAKYKDVINLMDYAFLNNQKLPIDMAKLYFKRMYPKIKVCAGNIDTMEIFESLKKSGGYHLFEGSFYRVPVTKGAHEVAPLKVNYIKLLNVVNNDDFKLAEAADVIGRDTALTISLLKMVNRMTVNSGITTLRHAAAMLGQKELRKWINTAVVDKLYADKPNEVTRLSLLRAKFAEYLAPLYGLRNKTEELFLMGLFSVLDVILEKPMEEALKMVMVAGEVREALVSGTGILAPVLDMVRQYEAANWPEVCRQLLLAKMEVGPVSDAYMKSLLWYRELHLISE